MPATLNHDESDHESVSDLLSPSDGYFTEGHTHPGDVLVPDPSQGRNHLDKEREAREQLNEGQRSSTNLSHGIDTSAASQSRTSQPRTNANATSSARAQRTNLPEVSTETTPLIPSAPPAYSPPEPGSPYHQTMRTAHQPGIYDTITRSDRFFPNNTEDMGGEERPFVGGDEDDKKSWGNRINNWWERNSYRVFKYLMLTFAFCIAIGFIVDAVLELSMENERRHDNDSTNPSHGLPANCKLGGSGKVTFSWNKADDWRLLHLPRSPPKGATNVHVQTLGKIHIVPAPEGTLDDVTVNMVYHYSSSTLGTELELMKEEGLLKIFTASELPDYLEISDKHPCQYLDITIQVRPDIKQERFAIGTSVLDVIFGQNHTAKAGEVYVATIAGSVTSLADSSGEANWGGRNIKIITDASSISGTFPLYDSLYLETTSASIDVDLTLQKGQYYDGTEARLFVKSMAGSIDVDTPILRTVEASSHDTDLDSIPKRIYHTDIEARSGSTRLKLVHGSHTSIQSTSGSIQAELTPWLEPRKESNIVVNSESGGTDVTVRDAIAYRGQPLRNLYSRYTYASGHLTLRYPAEWEGNVEGNVMTGGITVDWPGLQIIRRERLGPYTKLVATKGKGDATLKFTGASGSATLMGKGGSKYPIDSKEPKSDDHRRLIGDNGDQYDNDDTEWPIILPPMLRKLEALANE